MSTMRAVVLRDAAIQESYRSSAEIVRNYLGSRTKSECTQLPLFFTPIETAALLRISHRTLEKMRLQNRGPSYFRLGDSAKCRILYSLENIAEWLARNARDTHTSIRQR